MTTNVRLKLQVPNMREWILRNPWKWFLKNLLNKNAQLLHNFSIESFCIVHYSLFDRRPLATTTFINLTVNLWHAVAHAAIPEQQVGPSHPTWMLFISCLFNFVKLEPSRARYCLEQWLISTGVCISFTITRPTSHHDTFSSSYSLCSYYLLYFT